jgi:hypothetical protein
MPKKKPIDGLQHLLDFVEFLRSERIHFLISNKSDVSITVDFGLLGIRFEADFYPDEMVFAHFAGSDVVSKDDALLDALLKKHGEIKTKRQPSNV